MTHYYQSGRTPSGLPWAIGAAAPTPGADRPAWLKPYALVTGRVSSAPLDLPARMEQVYSGLRARGWNVVVRSIGTDFSGPLGVPVAKDQPVELYLHRTGAYTASEAQDALRDTLRSMNLDYSPLGAWAGEVFQNVVQPTIQQAAAKVEASSMNLGKWIALGVGGVLAVRLLTAGK